jgi:hypothetical protein
MDPASHSRLGLFALVSTCLLGACVTYRDRIVIVTQNTQIDARTTTVNPAVSTNANASASVTVNGTLADSPPRIDADAITHALDGYGQWIESPAYGTVWIPEEARQEGFTPYLSNGEWVATVDGWYWQSGYAWGAIPFHHGRWAMVGALWAWVPGAAFAPAWVDWRYGNGWIAWSPLPPLGASFGAPHVYCAWSRLGGPGLYARTVQGPAARALYGYTAPLREVYASGGAYYVPGPRVPTGVTVTARAQWSAHPSTPRVGVPVAGMARVGVPTDGAPADSVGRPPSDRALNVQFIPAVRRVYTAANGTLRPADSYPVTTHASALLAGDGRATLTHASPATERAGNVSPAPAPSGVRFTRYDPGSSFNGGGSGYTVVPAPRRMTWAPSLPAAPVVAPAPVRVMPPVMAAPTHVFASPAVVSAASAAPSYRPSFVPSAAPTWASPMPRANMVRPSVTAPVYAPTVPNVAYRAPVVAPTTPIAAAMPVRAAPSFVAPAAPTYRAPPAAAPHVVAPAAPRVFTGGPMLTHPGVFH